MNSQIETIKQITETDIMSLHRTEWRYFDATENSSYPWNKRLTERNNLQERYR